MSPTFFLNLKRILTPAKNLPIIVGGDWNCTFSCLDLATNPDVAGMSKLPNAPNSVKLEQLAAKLELTDPYRIFSPCSSDFTFIPGDKTKHNRSRLDFFLVSRFAVCQATSCIILPNLQSSLFDHKAVVLDFRPVQMKLTRPSISKFILKDELLDLVVKISAAECYIHHGSEADRLTAASQLQALGRARALLRDAGADPSLLPAEGHSEETALRRAAIIDEVAQLLELFNLQSLQCSPLNIEDDLFLEYLVNCIK